MLPPLLTRSAHCFTLSRGGRAESDFRRQRENKPNLIRELVQEITQTDNVTKGNYQEEKLTQRELGPQI